MVYLFGCANFRDEVTKAKENLCWAGGGLLALISLTTKSDLHFHIQNFKLSQ